MNMDEFTIILKNKTAKSSKPTAIPAKKGQSLMYALSENGIFVRADCGGNGRCAKCAVKIIQGFPESKMGLENIDQNTGNTNETFRNALACQERVTQNLVIEIPQATRLSPDIISKPRISQKLKMRISGLLKRGPSTSGHALAIDLGTTTIAVYLCDMDSGSIDGTISLKNPQALFGSDVMSRITALAENPMILRRLGQVVVQAIDWGIRNLSLSKKRIDPENIKRMVVVGNPTMLHLFLGKDPSAIGVAPYLPKFYDTQTAVAGQFGFNFSYDAQIVTIPLISGFLGADIVAASLAVDLRKQPFGTVLADVGTNGELMAVGSESMIATSCATGPALEGDAIRHGMQAVSGAISAVSIDMTSGRVKYMVKGSQKPQGICGSGIISAVAEMLRAKILLPDGRFDQSAGCDRIRLNDNNIPEFVLVYDNESGTGQAITLTQADIRNVQLAKGAFRSGIDLLCEKIGLESPRRLLVAGAFGNYIRKRDALTIGMFPPMSIKNIHIVGNAAGEGAILALFDPDILMHAHGLANFTQVIDLASHKNFQDHFVDSLSFPES
jgi:uncharacterized 2Fe-2S/4Fe-4S cluster protein (DUF4445 family)